MYLKTEKEFSLEEVAIRLPKPCKPFLHVPSSVEPDIDDFVANLLVPGQPAVLTGITKQNLGMKKSASSIKNFKKGFYFLNELNCPFLSLYIIHIYFYHFMYLKPSKGEIFHQTLIALEL